MNRTHDLLITNQLLSRLSYSSVRNFGQPGLVVTNQLLYQLSYTSILRKRHITVFYFYYIIDSKQICILQVCCSTD